MLDNASSKDYQASMFCKDSLVVDVPDVLHDVQYKARVLVRVEVNHVPYGPISQCRAIHWDVVLKMY